MNDSNVEKTNCSSSFILFKHSISFSEIHDKLLIWSAIHEIVVCKLSSNDDFFEKIIQFSSFEGSQESRVWAKLGIFELHEHPHSWIEKLDWLKRSMCYFEEEIGDEKRDDESNEDKDC